MLIIAALVWIALHIGVAGTRLRQLIVRRIGDGTFRSLFAVLSIAVLIWLARAYSAAATTALWAAPAWLKVLLVLAMLPACFLLVGSITTPNPTAVGGERAPARATGVLRITRHPMLWSFAIWAAVHVIGNGDTASFVFFGAFLLTALAGMPSIDAKLARREPARWSDIAASSSIIPFAATVQGRNRIVWSDIGWWRVAIALLLWVVLLVIHPWIFGVSPLPQ